MIFKLLFVVLLIASPRARDRQTLQTLMQQRNYAGVLKLEDKYPTLFEGATEKGWLASAYARKKQFADATLHCQLAMEMQNLSGCRALLMAIRKKEAGSYLLGNALYHHKIADYRQAMNLLAQHLLLKDPPEEQRSRLLFLRTLKRGSLYHVMDEVLRTARPSSAYNRYEKQVNSFVQKTRFWLKRKEKLTLAEDGRYISMLIAITGQNEFDWALKLARNAKTLLQEEGFQEALAIRLGRLLIATGSREEARKHVKRIENSIGTPLHRFSLMVLKNDLGTAEPTSAPKDESPRQASKVIDIAQSISSESLTGLPVETNASPLDLTPIDFSELKLATPSDLSPYDRLIEAYDERMADNPSEYERRFLFQELDNAYYEFRDNPETSEAFHAWLNTPQAQDFISRVNEMEKEFLKVDKINAKAFAGEAERFERDLSYASTRDEKLRVLSNYAGKWDKLVFGAHTNLFVKGAAVAFRQTEEGTRIAKRVYDLVQELELLPEDMHIPPDFLEERDW